MTRPSAGAEVRVVAPVHAPALTEGAARELARILQAAARARLEQHEIGRPGEDPEAIAS